MVKLQSNKMKTANIFSILTYWWMNEFFRKGQKIDLKESDMLDLFTSDTSDKLCVQLERNWANEVGDKSKKPSLFRALVYTHRRQLFLCGLASLLEEMLRLGTAIIISYLVKYFEEKDHLPLWHAYAYAAAVTVVILTLGMMHHQVFYWNFRIGWHMRVSVCALMYKKTLLLSQKSLCELSSGKILNLGATDVIRYDFFPPFVNFIWIGPLETIIATAILWQEFGSTVLAGMGYLVFAMLIQSMCGKQYAKLRLIIAALTDARVLGMNEVITGMRIIKMYAWEKPFAKMLSERRRKEVSKILRSASIKSFNMTLFMVQEKVITMITLLCFVLTGGSLSAFKVFFLIGILGAVRLPAGMALLQSIERTSEAISSSRRIQEYLLSDEFTTKRTKPDDPSQSAYVEMRNVIAQWSSSDDVSSRNNRTTLDDVSFRVNPGELLAVIGPVGAGKSSLLSAILGELPVLSGEVSVQGNVAYAAQTPWIFSGTVRDNILFGAEFDADRYKKTIKSCCLTKDLELLQDGDLTVIGERGVNLSGGQKARVNLARVAYRKDCNICLLDDPLSAVDPSVARHLYASCISGELLKDKVRILVTHQLQLLKTADKILILKEGKIAGMGTYEELEALQIDFASLLRPEIKEDKEKPEVRNNNFRRNENVRESKKSVISAISFDGSLNEEKVIASEPEEQRQQGSIESHVYLEYFRIGSKVPVYIIFVILVLASHSLYLLVDWWLSVWTVTHFDDTMADTNATFVSWNDFTPSSPSSTSENPGTTDSSYYLIVYLALCLTMVIAMSARLLLNTYLCVTSGIHMHKRMFHAILHAPIRFFDTNPSGRILNRFSKDMGQVDELLPNTLQEFLYIMGHTVGVVILIAAVNYLTLIIVIPAVIYFIWLRRFYMKVSRDIKRLEGSCRSPVFSLLSTTLQGLTTIRSFGVESRFTKMFHETQDLHSASWFLFLTGSRWFGLRLEIIGGVLLSVTAVASVLASSLLGINAGLLGLILTQCTSSVGLFQWGVRQSAEVENLMTSVERIQQYYKLKPEAPREIPNTQPHTDWPFRGSMEFQNVSFAYYDDGPNVLSGLNFSILPNEKIGLVGRTGAGKSSVISALFRLAELSDGKIYIDGIDVSTIGLHDLRSKISIIPQDPMLFTGTLRRNLDLFGLYNDDEVWNSLKRVQLYDFVMSLTNQLKTEMTEAGSNFSVGQRQLICLARALLRRNKILLIDEATANVDPKTDSLIQETIREEFTDCTVITIAHRINTIIDSNRIIVLDAGSVVEFDGPHTLLQNPNGHFYAMVEAMGTNQARSIRQTAEMAFQSAKRE